MKRRARKGKRGIIVVKCVCRNDKLCTLALPLPPILFYIVTIRLDNVLLAENCVLIIGT